MEVKINALLFKDSFDSEKWEGSEKIEYLLSSLLSIEQRVKKYLDGIRVDFPQLTDHSLLHSRMLWNYADTIVGKRFYLNPLEAFILDVAFLIHDSGMCYSILNNKDEIKKEAIYQDYLTKYKSSSSVEEDALFYTVRQKHGDFAFKVATEKLSHDEYLIDDTSLREEFSIIIGKIAKSHSCNVSYIEREFISNYVSPNFPVSWAVDCSKLCFVLRVSDAAHLDKLRTPESNYLISKLQGVSKEHWVFQKKMGYPSLKDGLLLYSTSEPFKVNEQRAWWLAYDSLTMLDKELRNAQEYFTKEKEKGFLAIGVKAIDNTLELGRKYLKTDGWDSFDTTIKASNPVRIASELGGIKLYQKSNVAIRELIQNSIDAINLLRIYKNSKTYGEINLELSKKENSFYFTITDNGIGMSSSIMVNELLDFGSSYWKGNQFTSEFKGVLANGFQSIGEFGIGFFSVFMIGSEVSVTSLKFGESDAQMRTLEFNEGINSHPILRLPTEVERQKLFGTGTSITIKLSLDPTGDKGIIGEANFVHNSLRELVKYFAPFSNILIRIKEVDDSCSVFYPILPSQLTYTALLDHISTPIRQKDEYQDLSLPQRYEIVKQLNFELLDVADGNRHYGKLSLIPHLRQNTVVITTSIILFNGMRVGTSFGSEFVGYICIDKITSLKRDSYDRIVPYEALLDWAKRQIEFIEASNLKPMYGHTYFGFLLTFNLFDDTLPILLTKQDNNYRYFTVAHLKLFIQNNTELCIFYEGSSELARAKDCEGFINLTFFFNILPILKDTDHDKIMTAKKLIEELLERIWGGFERVEKNLDSLANGYISVDTPYRSVIVYKKKH